MTSETTSYSGGVLVQRVVVDDVAQTVTVFDGKGAQVSSRPWTAQEIAKAANDAASAATAAQLAANADTLRTRASAALGVNTTYLGHAALPAGASLTTTQLTTAVRLLIGQVDALTKQNNALIRLTAVLLNDISDTA